MAEATRNHIASDAYAEPDRTLVAKMRFTSVAGGDLEWDDSREVTLHLRFCEIPKLGRAIH